MADNRPNLVHSKSLSVVERSLCVSESGEVAQDKCDKSKTSWRDTVVKEDLFPAYDKSNFIEVKNKAHKLIAFASPISATVYHGSLQGDITSIGEMFNHYEYTIAVHERLKSKFPVGSFVKLIHTYTDPVTKKKVAKEVIAKVTDRKGKKGIDLTKQVASALNLHGEINYNGKNSHKLKIVKVVPKECANAKNCFDPDVYISFLDTTYESENINNFPRATMLTRVKAMLNLTALAILAVKENIITGLTRAYARKEIRVANAEKTPVVSINIGPFKDASSAQVALDAICIGNNVAGQLDTTIKASLCKDAKVVIARKGLDPWDLRSVKK